MPCHNQIFWHVGSAGGMHRLYGSEALVKQNTVFSENVFITKSYQYIFDPLKPHFYIVKLGFTGVNIIFLISAQKHRLWVLIRIALVRQF